MSIYEVWDMNSDHFPIVLTFSDEVIQKKAPPRLVNDRIAWQRFRKELEELVNIFVPLKTKEQLVANDELFTKHIQ